MDTSSVLAERKPLMGQLRIIRTHAWPLRLNYFPMNPDAKQATKIPAKRVEKHPRSNLSCNKLGYCRLRKVVAVSTLCHKICSCCTFYLPMIRVWSDSHIIYQIRRLYSCIFHQPDLLHDRFERGWQNTYISFLCSSFYCTFILYTPHPGANCEF